jgi:hypothetical protein
MWAQFKNHFHLHILQYQKGHRGNQDGINHFGLMGSGHMAPLMVSNASTISSVTSFQEVLAQANNAAMADMAAT